MAPREQEHTATTTNTMIVESSASKNELETHLSIDEKNADDNDATSNSIIPQEISKQQQQHSTVVLCWCMLIHSWLLISVFPYSGFMAVDLVDGLTEETAGSYAGLIASAFMLGRAFSSYGWGKAADRYGRKFVLIGSLTLSMIFSTLFGLSTSFALALLWRFMLGLSNGIVGTAKTTVSELARGNESIETKSMGLVMGMWGWGFLFSPALSGILSEPLRQYPDAVPEIFDDFLSAFPFILPNLLSALFCTIGILSIHYYVPETLSNPRSFVHIPSDTMQSVIDKASILFGDVGTKAKTTITTTGKTIPESAALLGGSDETNPNNEQTYGSVSSKTSIDNNSQGRGDNSTIRQARMIHTESCTMLSTDSPRNENTSKDTTQANSHKDSDDNKNSNKPATQEATVLSLWSRKNTRNHLLVNWIYSFVAIALEEAFPLYCISRESGLGLSEATIGKLLSSSGFLFAVSQYFVYSYLVDTVGLQRSIQIGAMFSGPLLVLLPVARFLNQGGSTFTDTADSADTIFDAPSNGLTWSAFIFLSILLAFYRVFSLCFFSSISIATNRTVPASHRGTMNGLSMLGGSITKGLGPIFAGALVSFSTSSGIVAPEFGGLVIYGVLGLLGFITVATIFCLLTAADYDESDKNPDVRNDANKEAV